MQLSCGMSNGAYREVITSTESAQGHIAHPVSSAPQPLVTSAQEWTTVWRDTARTLPAEIAPNSLAFVDAVANAAPTQPQNRCSNSKEDPTDSPSAPPGEPADDIPNLDPSALPPAAPAPELPATTPMPEPPATTPVPETSTPVLSIPSRPVSPPPSDPSVDPTNVTPTSEPATPFDGVVVPTLETLPDGVYRYLSGNYEYGVYSNEQLIANGGAIFLLTKTGDSVVGHFYPKFGQSGVCIDGSLSGNSVVGPAYVIEAIPDESADAESANSGEPATAVGDSYEPYAGLSTFQVRQPQTVGGRIFYAESLLDLSEYSRINAGTSLAPSECDVPIVESASPADAD